MLVAVVCCFVLAAVARIATIGRNTKKKNDKDRKEGKGNFNNLWISRINRRKLDNLSHPGSWNLLEIDF